MGISPNNKYGLFELTDWEKAQIELELVMSDFAMKIHDPHRKYPNLGIRDTEVSENIVEDICDRIH